MADHKEIKSKVVAECLTDIADLQRKLNNYHRDIRNLEFCAKKTMENIQGYKAFLFELGWKG